MSKVRNHRLIMMKKTQLKFLRKTIFLMFILNTYALDVMSAASSDLSVEDARNLKSNQSSCSHSGNCIEQFFSRFTQIKIPGDVSRDTKSMLSIDDLVSVRSAPQDEKRQGAEALPEAETGGAENPTKQKGEKFYGYGDAPCTAPEPIDITTVPFLGTFRNCFSKREKMPIDKSINPKYSSTDQYLYQDQSICQCHDQTLIANKEVYKKTPQEIELDMIKGNINHKLEEVEQMSNGMMIQAHLMTSSLVDTNKMSKSEHLKLVAKYKAKTDDSDAKKLDDFKKSLKEKSSSFGENGSAYLKEIDKISLPKNEIKFEEFPMDKIPAKPPGSCFSMKTFLAIEMKPNRVDDREFLKEFKKTSSINPDEWNMKNLKRDYDQAVNDITESDEKYEKIKKIKSKIVFLKKNPLYANLFASKDPEVKNSQNELLKNLQQEYFNDQRCSNDLKCLVKLRNEKSSRDQKISEIFQRPEVFKATREVLNEDILSHFQNPDEITQTKLPTTQNGLEERFSSIHQGKSSVSNCSGDDMTIPQLLECSNNYSEYCQYLNKIVEANNNNDDSKKMSPSDELLESIDSSFSLDPMKNKKFLDMTEDICNDKRIKIDGDSVVQMNFGQYKRKYKEDFCGVQIMQSIGEFFSGEKSVENEACENDNLILAKFLKDFPISPQRNKSGHYSSYIDSYVQEFASIESKSSSTLTRADENDLNTQSVSFGDIQKFGANSAFNSDYIPSSKTDNVVSNPETTTPQATSFSANDSFNNYSFNQLPFATNVTGAATESSAAANSERKSTSSSSLDSADSSKSHIPTREELEEELNKYKSSLSDLDNSEEIDAMKKRIAELEKQLLAQSEELKRKSQEASSSGSETKNPASSNPSSDQSSRSETFAKAAKEELDQDSSGNSGASGSSLSRSPASLGSAPAGFGAGANGVVGARSSSKTSQDQFNNALLSKYSVSVDGSTDGKYLVARDIETDGLIKLTKVFEEQEKSSSVTAVVTKSEFEKIKANDLKNLAAIYEKKIKALGGNVVKLSISQQGDQDKKDVIEYYVVNEAGKVVFQPVRKVTLDNLIQEIADPNQ